MKVIRTKRRGKQASGSDKAVSRCLRKIPYRIESDAIDCAKSMAKAYHKTFKVYFCYRCRNYHVANKSDKDNIQPIARGDSP